MSSIERHMDVPERVLVSNNATPAPLPQNEGDEVREGDANNRLGNDPFRGRKESLAVPFGPL